MRKRLIAAAIALAAFSSLSVTARADECDAFAQTVMETPAPPATPSGLKTALDKIKGAPDGADTVFVGDSLLANWQGDVLKRDFPDRKIWNLAVSGHTAQNAMWVLGNIDPKAVDPKTVVVVVGTNNFSSTEMPPCAIAAGIRKIADMARGYWPNASIVLSAIPPRGPDFQLRAAERAALNDSLKAYADGLKNMSFVSFDEMALTCGNIGKPTIDSKVFACKPDVKYMCKFYKDDNLHFSADGYTVFRTAIAQSNQSKFGADILQ